MGARLLLKDNVKDYIRNKKTTILVFKYKCVYFPAGGYGGGVGCCSKYNQYSISEQ